jgi:hypothetical protein
MTLMSHTVSERRTSKDTMPTDTDSPAPTGRNKHTLTGSSGSRPPATVPSMASAPLRALWHRGAARATGGGGGGGGRGGEEIHCAGTRRWRHARARRGHRTHSARQHHAPLSARPPWVAPLHVIHQAPWPQDAADPAAAAVSPQPPSTAADPAPTAHAATAAGVVTSTGSAAPHHGVPKEGDAQPWVLGRLRRRCSA